MQTEGEMRPHSGFWNKIERGVVYAGILLLILSGVAGLRFPVFNDYFIDRGGHFILLGAVSLGILRLFDERLAATKTTLVAEPFEIAIREVTSRRSLDKVDLFAHSSSKYRTDMPTDVHINNARI